MPKATLDLKFRARSCRAVAVQAAEVPWRTLMMCFRQTPLFGALSNEDASGLRSCVIERRRLKCGERLFAAGDTGDMLFIIVTGKIKLTRAAPDGRANLLTVHGPGEMFGEVSLFDPMPHTASATAVTSTRLATLAHDALGTWPCS